MMGVQLLSQLTCEMNQISEADANRSLTKHRKIASSFRDSQLFEVKYNGLSIFEKNYTFFSSVYSGIPALLYPPSHRLREQEEPQLF